MFAIAIVLAAGAVVGLVVFGLVRRWPAPVSAPSLDPTTIRHAVRRSAVLRRLLGGDLDPEAETGVLLTLAVVVLIVLAAVVGILLFMVRARWGLASLDGPVARFAARHATATSTTFMRDLSLIGGTVGVIVLSVVVGVVEYRRIPQRAIPLFLALAALGQFAVANLVKLAVDRARPAVDRLTGFSGSSFPSGHAVASAATLAALALLLGRRRSVTVRAALTGTAAGIATMVGASRIFLGVHWFTDVLGGLCIGWGWFVLCSLAFGGRLLRYGAPVATAEVMAEHPGV